MSRKPSFVAALAAFLVFIAASPALSQGVTTGVISGRVTTADGNPVESAQVQVVNSATGVTTNSTTRSNGLYYVPSLEVGGPYTVRVRRIGFRPTEQTGLNVTLSQVTRADFRMEAQAVTLATITTTADAEATDFSPSRQGVGTVVRDTLIRRLPTLDRNITDFVKLTPQVVSNDLSGPSAAGGFNRLNNFTIDGANQNDRFNLSATGGTPGGASRGRIASVEAIKEFQVLLSPTDVRHGNFAGMLVNAVTKNGTNDFTGSAVYMWRNPGMARDIDAIRASDFRIKQYAFSLGGPIVPDRIHFFVAHDRQERTDPTAGPFLSGNVVTSGNFSVSADSVNRVRDILASRFDVGTAGVFRRTNPLKNMSARLDWAINDQNRMVVRVLDNVAEQDEFSRSTAGLTSSVLTQTAGIRLTSNAYLRQAKNRSWAAQLFSNWADGKSNEFLVGFNSQRDFRIIPINTPEISVGVTPVGGTTPSAAITVGSERFSPGNDNKQAVFELRDDFTIPRGAHTITLGGRYEYTDIYNFFLSGAANGAYQFPTIAALAAGTPSGFAFSYANAGSIAAAFEAQQFSAYAQDLWSFSDRLSISAGLRVDVPHFLDSPKFNPLIAERVPLLRTDFKPKRQYLWSPRIGFNWDVAGDRTTQLRGNLGIYTGQTPYIVIGNAFGNTGLGAVTVACTAAGTVPPLVTDVSQLPKSCAGLAAPTPGQAGTIGINVNDPNFKYPQNWTASFGLDHQLPFGFVGSFEALYRKDINPIAVRDLNLKGPRLVGGQVYRDRDGRILYADTITVSSTGSLTVTNNNQKRLLAVGTPAVTFSEGAIQLTNANAGHNYALTTTLRKRFSRAFEVTTAYTYMQAKDYQSITSDRAISIWRNGKQHAGLEWDPENATTSEFQRPHRVIAYGTWTSPWRRFQTDMTFYFEGVSGGVLSYIVNNDINGDGVFANDMMYVPRDATDPNEIRIGTGAGTAFALDPAHAALFERFIELQPCLDEQRGRIATRNSCSAPFQKRMDFSLRQTLPEIAGQRLTVQWDVFNFLNLLNKDWGQNKFPATSTFNRSSILLTAGRTTGPLSTGQWNYNLPTALLNTLRDEDSPWTGSPNSASSNYQMQMTLRYSF